LEFPEKMDDLNLSIYECSPSDSPHTIGPYLGNHVRRRSPDRLILSVVPHPSYFTILVGDACEGDPTQEDWFVSVGIITSAIPEEEGVGKFCFDIIAHIPLEKVVYLKTALPILQSEEICIQMRNLTHLRLEEVDLSTWFIEPDTPEPHVFKDLLRGLRSISISSYKLGGGDWSPLTSFLTRRAAVGNWISSLSLSHYMDMDDDVVESISRTVDVFDDGRSDDGSDDGSDGSD
jgi:hypothetical protein